MKSGFENYKLSIKNKNLLFFNKKLALFDV